MEKDLHELSKKIAEVQKKHYIADLRIDGYKGAIGTYLDAFKESPMNRSSYNRLARTYQLMRYKHVTPKTTMTCTVFKATRDDITSNYAYLYSSSDHARQRGSPFIYFATGSTFRSQDGEYRRRFVTFDMLAAARSSAPFEIAEKLVLSKMDNGELALFCNIFYSESEEDHTLEKRINDERLAILLYAFAWMFDYHRCVKKYIENHIHPGYQHVMCDGEDAEAITAYREMIDAFGGITKYDEFVFRMSADNTPIARGIIAPPEIGQKMFALSIGGIRHIHDIRFAVWRELYLTKICATLVINFITPSFALLNDWFIIQSAHPGLFDNLASYSRYENSKIAKELRKRLIAADSTNYGDEGSKQAIDIDFDTVSSKIRETIEWTEQHIILSSTALCMTVEHVGVTVKDMAHLVDNPPPYTSYELIATDLAVFKRHMFEFIYTLFVINTKFTVMHGDLHGNNATIYQYYRATDSDEKMAPREQSMQREQPMHRLRGSVLYIMTGADDKEQLTFMFPHTNMYSVIIDMSKGIFGDYAKVSNKFGEVYARSFFDDQNERVMQMIKSLLPKFYQENKARLLKVMSEDFYLFFKVVTAVDTIKLTRSIDAAIREITRVKVPSEILAFSRKLVDMADRLFIDNFQRIFKERLTADSLPWPNYRIMLEMFGDFIVVSDQKSNQKSDDAVVILDVFNYTNDIKYNFNHYENWSPLMRLDDEITIAKAEGFNIDETLTDAKRIKEEKNEMQAVTKISERYSSQFYDVGVDEFL